MQQSHKECALVHARAVATPATPTPSATAAERRLDKIAARFAPLPYATANGDSCHDDRLGMAIAFKVL